MDPAGAESAQQTDRRQMGKTRNGYTLNEEPVGEEKGPLVHGSLN